MESDDAYHCPAIFFISGYGGNKEAGLSLGYRLARRGLFFISFDAWLHGERYDRRLDHAADPELGGIYPLATGLDTGIMFYRVIHHCLQDVQFLLNHYADDRRVNTRRAGVTGLSMGGYASFLIFANVPAIQAAVPMIGLPSFTRRWLDVLEECSFSNPDWAAVLVRVQEQTRQHTTFIQQIDPYEKLKSAAPRALLIMNGDFDTDRLKFYSIRCYKELQPYYAGIPEKLKLNIYPAGHVVTPQMETDAVDWFGRHLLDTP
jgi:hypothetical protein